MNQYTNQNDNYQRSCPKCGTHIEYDNMYCPKCGYDFTGNRAKNKKKNLIISILAVLLVSMMFVIAALAVHVKLNGKDENKIENTSKAEVMESTQTPFVETPAPDEKKNNEKAEENNQTEIPATKIPENDNVDETQSEDSASYAYGPYDVILSCSLNTPEYSVVEFPTYNKYHDSEFGFTIDYPAEFTEYSIKNPVVKGYYSSADGSAHMRICAAYNKGDVTPEQMKNSFISTHGGSVTYSAGKSEWFAVSTDDYADDQYHYAYYSVRNGKIIGFEFHFEGQENLDIYSKYIDTIYASLKRQ